MRQVFVAQHPTEAYCIKDLLEAVGIAAEVRGEDLFGARGSIPTTPETLPSVWVVNDDDAARARLVLADYGGAKVPRRVEEMNGGARLVASALNLNSWNAGAVGRVDRTADLLPQRLV